MIINEKQLFSFIPIEIVRENEISFECTDSKLVINEDSWPCNLIYNPELIISEDVFYENMCSDSTLYFYIKSAIGRCKSLVSRAIHNPSVIWEHGSIRVLEMDGGCPERWMIRTRTEVAIRTLNDNQ